MTKPFLLVALLTGLAAGPALAQQSADHSDAEAPAAEGEQSPAEAALAEPNVGDVYRRQEHDWTVVCEKTLSGDDPCRMAQLLRDDNENPVMEAELTRLEGPNLPAALMVVNTPLMTLLTEGVTITIDGGQPAKIPYLFCDNQACVARVNLRDQDVTSFKRGNVAKITIVPLAAPDSSVSVDMSLTGFTAAYDSIPTVKGGQ